MATTSLLLPELVFLSPQTTHKHWLSLSKPSLSINRRYGLSLRTRIRAATKEEGVVVDERERKLIKELNGNGAAGAQYSVSEERRYSNGGVGVAEKESENGRLVKYVNGNGAAATVAAELVVEEAQNSAAKEDGRKRRVEEIGKEDAWFKQSGQEQIEVKKKKKLLLV